MEMYGLPKEVFDSLSLKEQNKVKSSYLNYINTTKYNKEKEEDLTVEKYSKKFIKK